MKCVANHKDGEVRRLPDDDAHRLVTDFDWYYVPKHVWKSYVHRKTVKAAPSTFSVRRV